jgi:hypothetical protein
MWGDGATWIMDMGRSSDRSSGDSAGGIGSFLFIESDTHFFLLV